jgi:3-hydroxybutyryl-CoA dehydrogenase
MVVGVIGAGVIGMGVAQSLAQAGHEVILLDLTDPILAHARETIARDLRFQRMLAPGSAKGDGPAVLERIRCTTTYEPLREAGFVVENVVESWPVKAAVHQQLDCCCPPECVFAANTSAISITRLASVTQRPSQVLGMHFMNPVPLKPLVEVIRGYHTSDGTIEAGRRLLASMGKEGVVVGDMPGFVSNRVLMLTINEAVYLLQEQVATAQDVDRIFKLCFGHKMGPLETADLIGLDTVLLSIEVLQESFEDSKYRPCPLLRKMVAAGLHGRKSGQGFYTYAGLDGGGKRDG